MIKLFHGDNSYSSWEAMRQDIKDRDNIQWIEGRTLIDLDSIFIGVDSYSMFESSNKLTVVKRFFKNKRISLKKSIVSVFEKKNLTQSDVYFWENEKVDKRTQLYKYIKNKGKVEEYNFLDGQRLVAWVIKEARSFGFNITFRQAEKIIDIAGTNQLILQSEIIKLQLLLDSRGSKNLTVEDLEVVSVTEKEKDIWTLMDAISRKDRNMAITEVNNVLKKNEDFAYVSAMITRQLKILILLKQPNLSNKENLYKVKKFIHTHFKRLKDISTNLKKKILNVCILNYWIWILLLSRVK